jgi:hypothetical protein
MPTLPVALQEGFAQDDIVVRVNGSEIPLDTVGSPRSETIVTPKRLVEDIPEVRVGRAIVGWAKSQPPVDQHRGRRSRSLRKHGGSPQGLIGIDPPVGAHRLARLGEL